MRIILLIILLSFSSLCHAGIWWGSPGDVSDVEIVLNLKMVLFSRTEIFVFFIMKLPAEFLLM